MLTKIMLLIFLVSFHVRPANGLVQLAVQIGLTVLDLASLGYNVYEIFERENDGNDIPENLVAQIDNLLDVSTDTIITQIWLSSKLEHIDDAVKSIYSTMIDLESLIKVNESDDRARYEDRFKLNYLNQGITEHVRFLQKLLTNAIPGTSGSMLDLYTDYYRCNMSSLYEFERFYYDLISIGISLEVIYNYLQYGIPVDNTMDEWRQPVKDLEETFSSYENRCMSKYSILVKEDIHEVINAQELNKTLNERYPWKSHDIFDLKSFGTHQFLYHFSKDGQLMTESLSNITRIVVSIDRNMLYEYSSKVIVNVEQLRPSIERKYAAAKHVGERVSTVVVDQGLHLGALISFFNNDDDFAPHRIILDNESPVQKVIVPRVSLTYCHETGVECTLDNIDFLNIIDGEKTVNGNLEVYFYPRGEPFKDETPTIGSAPGHVENSTIFGMVMLMFVVAFVIPK
ncbi:hypothetical protein ACF0H5_000688 [Mactra antiquata]